MNYIFTVCGGNYTNAAGILTSPSYPNLNQYMADCVYLISQPSGTFINFTLINMDIDCGVFSPTEGYLELRDGNSANSPLIGKLCGSNSIPALKQTSHNYIRAR